MQIEEFFEECKSYCRRQPTCDNCPLKDGYMCELSSMIAVYDAVVRRRKE
jgi:hypothetical protein